MIKKASWGRLSNHGHNVEFMNERSSCTDVIKSSLPGVVFGNGRSYGDVCLNPGGNLWDSLGLNKFISFDQEQGLLSCEAGVLLRDINQISIPRGWMLPVTPGTQLVTVGGAVANDIHGKNHHIFGSFGNHVLKFRLLRTDGEVIECSQNLSSDLFYATIGGIGLTGIILSVDIQLRRIPGSYVESENIPYENLEEFFTLSSESVHGWEHTVSWLDCAAGVLGRGVFSRGNFVDHNKYEMLESTSVKLPFEPPISLINKVSLKSFNKAYFMASKIGRSKSLPYYEKFLYPLDRILEWNKIYGPKGFYQYQSVIPKSVSYDATKEMLREIKSSGEGSFLAVLKMFGKKESVGMLSFPMEGVTLALDFPNKGKKTLELLDRLDRIVNEVGGRVYMAKDARMSKQTFEKGYLNHSDFAEFMDAGIVSSMGKRLF